MEASHSARAPLMVIIRPGLGWDAMRCDAMAWHEDGDLAESRLEGGGSKRPVLGCQSEMSRWWVGQWPWARRSRAVATLALAGWRKV